MIRAVVLWLVSVCLVVAAGVPDWVLTGIAKVETGSWRDTSGRWHYVDRRRGEHGERGMMQMSNAAFCDVAAMLPAMAVDWDAIDNPETAVMFAEFYLLHLHNRLGNWPDAVAAYNVGMTGLKTKRTIGEWYCTKVAEAGGK